MHYSVHDLLIRSISDCPYGIATAMMELSSEIKDRLLYE